MKISFFILSSLFAVLLTSTVMAQQTVVPSRTLAEQQVFDALNKRWNDALGTFQIQVVNSRIKPTVGVEVIEKIEAQRKEAEVVYIPLRENVRIMVLPKREIQKADFEKIPYFKYVQE